MLKKTLAVGMTAVLLFAAGCQGQQTAQTEQPEEVVVEETQEASSNGEVTMKGINLEPEEESAEAEEMDSAEDTSEGETAEPDLLPEDPDAFLEDAEEEQDQIVSETTGYRGLVVIDPGHQSSGDSEMEPNGPGSSEMKAKVTSGTAGVSTGIPEYELNLEVSLKLCNELESRGYEVIMTRESNDVRISNAERAEIANEAGADVFVRIHANGDDDSSVNGVITICQTAANPYNASLYSECRLLSDLVLDAVAEATGAQKQYVWETDTMTGINWAQVPSTIVEMGFMTNPTEDELMATEEYQYRIVEGIANGIDQFMEAEGK